MKLPTWYDRWLTAGAETIPEHICPSCGEFLELEVDPEGSEWHCPNQTQHTHETRSQEKSERAKPPAGTLGTSGNPFDAGRSESVQRVVGPSGVPAGNLQTRHD